MQEAIWSLWVNIHFLFTSANIYKMYESEGLELYKIAVMQNQPAQMMPFPIAVPGAPQPSGPGRPGQPAQPTQVAMAPFAEAGVTCRTCGTNYKFQLNFVPNVPIGQGREPFPKTGLFACRVCHTMHNLTGLKMQVEAIAKRPVIL